MSEQANARPLVGVAVIVRRNGRVLMGKRTNSHGEGRWAFPGGHLEWGEDLFDCARREVREETGLALSGARLGPYTNDVFRDEGKHYVTLFVVADALPGEPRLLEPDKCLAWDWFAWDALPEPLFLSTQNLLGLGYDPFSEDWA
ncbi:MAG: nucleotide triphosphate diphosphatase NUDT15 [Desulfatibacillaceae bacterium]